MRKIFSGKKIPKWAIVAGAVAAVVVLFLIVLAVYTYSSDSADGSGDAERKITAGGVELTGMTEEEAVKALKAAYDERYADASLTLKIDDVYTGEITAEQLGIRCDAEEIVKKAFSEDQNVVSEVPDVIITFDDAKVDALVSSIAEQCKVDPKEESYQTTDDKVIIDVAADGLVVNAEELKNEIRARFENENFEELVLSREIVPPTTVYGVDKIHGEVYKQATDAKIEANGAENKITPHVVGVDFDVEKAKQLYAENPGTRIELPLVFTQPKVLTKHLEGNLFQHKLVEVETHFSPKKVERTANVRLAAKYVNGTILNPGEEFSYNKVVGQRTKERGFKEAAIFASGEVVDGIGGGICQVSSTLYMAAIKANMKITQRKNHSFYVDYAPKGEDATVVYGSIDFKFVNTSKYPIKIVATSKNNYIRIAIMGTQPDDPKTVKLTKTTHSTTPFTTREKPTADLPLGERKVEQKGQPGISMTVYRNVYDKNGKLVESYVENTSKYKPMPEIVLVGTGPQAAPAAPAAPATPATPTTPAAPAGPATPAAPATPEPAPEIKPEQTPEVKPEPAPEVKPEQTPEVKPEPTPEVKPEQTPEVKPEPTPEVTPEQTPEVKPEPTPEVTPEQTPEVTPEPSPEETPSDDGAVTQ